MQVDFYQLAGTPVETVVPQLSAKVLEAGKRLLIVAGDRTLRSQLDEMLWTYDAASFIPHALSTEQNAEKQPVLLSETAEPSNSAEFIMLSDGIWRADALKFERAFYLFEDACLENARAAWRSLTAEEGVEPRYWRQDGGKWRQGP